MAFDGGEPTRASVSGVSDDMRLVDQSVGPYERVVWAHDPASGLQTCVAIHSTALGPAVGGCRFYPYPDQATAVLDALRLAAGMTLKSAAAGLDMGGGKAVIIGNPATDKTPDLLAAFAEVLNRLDGVYYTAEDVGTSTADMDALRTHTPFVLGVGEERGGSGDPSPYTARGVVAAMRAAWAVTAGHSTLRGAHVVVQGAGKVGGGVARLAAADGARVTIADVNETRVATLTAALGVETVPAAEALTTPCDILSPCALGGVLTETSVATLRCSLVCGAANNMLASDRVAHALAGRGIDYVPDFVANAGGIIAIADEMDGFDSERAGEHADAVGEIVAAIIEEAQATGESALVVAERRAARRIAAAGG